MPEFQNIPILPGEQVVFAADFTPSPILRANKSGLVVTKERVAVQHPQFIFLFFKVGHLVSSSPIRSLAEVSVGRLLSRHRIRLAIWCGLGGLMLLLYGLGGGMFGGGLFAAIFVLLALVLFAVAGFQLWLARQLGLTLCHDGGATLSVGGDSAEHQAMLTAAHIIQQLMLGRSDAVQPISMQAQGPPPTYQANDPYGGGGSQSSLPYQSQPQHPHSRW